MEFNSGFKGLNSQKATCYVYSVMTDEWRRLVREAKARKGL